MPMLTAALVKNSCSCLSPSPMPVGRFPTYSRRACRVNCGLAVSICVCIAAWIAPADGMLMPFEDTVLLPTASLSSAVSPSLSPSLLLSLSSLSLSRREEEDRWPKRLPCLRWNSSHARSLLVSFLSELFLLLLLLLLFLALPPPLSLPLSLSLLLLRL